MATAYGKAARWLKRELEALRKPSRAEQRLGRERAELEAYSAGQGSIGGATVGLMTVALAECRQGCERVVDGDGAGWEQVDRGLLYSAWQYRLLACAYDADTRPGKQARANLDGAANVWAHADALGAIELREWLEARFRKLDAGDRSLNGPDMNALVGLAAHYATGKSPAALVEWGWADLGPYEKAVSKPGLKPEDFDELAQYHVDQTGESGFQAFVSSPNRLVPFELFALEKRTGVRMENPQHPLLTSPLAVRREVREIPVPEELKRVIDRARKEMPL